MLANNETSIGKTRIFVGRKTPDADHGKPEVTVEKTGQSISKVIVKCTCSKEIIINCRYENETETEGTEHV